jgi:serine/threonine protein kinase
VLDGLEAIHARGIVHRDLKPENILVGDSLELPVKISDFGVAKHLGASTHGPSTAKGLVLGTPAYMAPEQVAGSPPAPASDLYALAIILYQLIVGRHPFPAEGTREMLHHQLWTEAPIPWSLHPALKSVLERGLAKSPSKRFASVAEFRSALRGIENEILAEAGVVPRSSGSVKMVEPARPTRRVQALAQARRLTLALGFACAGLVALAVPHVISLVR